VPVTRYELFRKRIAPVAFGVAIVLLARESCMKQHRTHATFVLEPGAAQQEIRSVEADVWIGDAEVSTYRRNADQGAYIGPMRFVAALPDPDCELHLDVDLGARGHRTFVRHVRADEGATVTVPLDSDLR
jgi:hypothetical protein